MKTLTRVVLPIAVIVGMVFGITYIINYTPNEKKEENKGPDKPVEALKFPLTSASANPKDWKLRYWNSDYEVGRHGEFYFWFRNVGKDPVRFESKGVSCKCLGVDVCVVPGEAMKQYWTNRAAAHLPCMPGAPILDALSVVELSQRIQWKPLPENTDISIPGANVEDPQLAIVKMKWEAKPPGENKDAKDSVTGYFVTQLPNANAAAMTLDVSFVVVPPFHAYVPGAENSSSVQLGNIVSGSIINREVIFWSKSRSELPLTFEPVTTGNQKDCVDWSRPERLSPAEIAELQKKLPASEQLGGKILSAYRTILTVYEQREVEIGKQKSRTQLDLGPLNVLVNVKAGAVGNLPETKAMPLYVQGVVRGEVRLFAYGEATDAVDFGTSFKGDKDESRRVQILSDRPGLKLELVEKECVPDIILAELNPMSKDAGNREWTLHVTIKANTLFGSLPIHSKVILRTQDSPPRRISIPVRAKQQE